ncbi:hypothetical protein HPB49_022095 [Dermacentor silvarum]|uniref:Uncharacterized protein n=1 Tax=Dermacentor silvarum TaxID=543639 RepID=A0ACB8E3F5_DERSI|nr:hypothetical protein HPB49_022095 [Dermacentor silvarum]
MPPPPPPAPTPKNVPGSMCQYNPFHKVKSGRLKIHMTKCRREHAPRRLKPCPSTKDHMAPANAEDYQRHLATCPDRSSTFCTATRDDPDPPFDLRDL